MPFCPSHPTPSLQGLDGLGYQEHIDYDLVESTNPAFGKAVVRINVFRQHRQVRHAHGYQHRQVRHAHVYRPQTVLSHTPQIGTPPHTRTVCK